jgi:hypothetical protein
MTEQVVPAQAVPILKQAAPGRLSFSIGTMRDTIGEAAFLFYGGPGTGKTHMLGTVDEVPELLPAVYVGFDNSWRTIAGCSFARPNIVRFDQMHELVRAIHTGAIPCKTLLLDGLDGLYSMCIREWMVANTASRVHPAVPAMQDYLVATSRFRTVMDSLAKLEKTWILCTCHMQEFKDEVNLVYVRPNMTGKLALEITQWFDFAGYLYVKAMMNKVQYYSQFSSFGRVSGKERTPKGYKPLGPVMESPSMVQIYAAIKLNVEPAHGDLSKLDDAEERLLTAQADIGSAGGTDIAVGVEAPKESRDG